MCVNQVGLIILFVNTYIFSIGESLECHSFFLDVGGNISEVELARPLIEGYGPNIFHNGKLIVIDCHCQRHF